jgi:hypothetical protein
MTLAIGFVVGKYEVLERLAAGGMGEVFRARDVSLGREVALKVLPPRLAIDEQRRVRFAREAEALAALNHPNIATLHEITDLDGVQALVLELIEGETLAERIARGSLDFREALAIARHIAAALEAAHDANIVHRDLKPENVKLRADGHVKLVDFGLAKVLGESRAGAATAAATATSLDPFGGAVLGTPAYMSPEQARGAAVDQRTDVWAFGCVLFEMLAGRRAFGGDTASDTLVSVLEREPDWSALSGRCPALVERLLRRCLTKDRAQRLRHIGDARLDLEEAASPGSTERGALQGRAQPPIEIAEVGTPRAARSHRAPAVVSRRVVVCGAVAAAAAVPLIAQLRRYSGGARAAAERVARDAAPERVAVGAAQGRVAVKAVPERVEVATARTSNPHYMAVAPHGRRLAYVGDGGRGLALWIRSLDSAAARVLPRTEGAGTLSYPFWSPDGRYVALRVDEDLVKVDVETGEPETITRQVGLLRRGSWSAEGEIIFASKVIKRVRAGRSAVPVTELARNETAHSAPSFLPDGQHFLYKATAGGMKTIYIGSLSGTQAAVPLLEAARAIYVEPGFILFTRRERLFAQPFDSDRLALTQDPVPILDDVYYARSIDTSAFDASFLGSLAVRHYSKRPGDDAYPITVFADWSELLDAQRGGRLVELGEA